MRVVQDPGPASVAVTGGGWWLERRDKKRYIERNNRRTVLLEQKIDADRSSSGLTESGDTNPEDRL